jgi:hypothetical protein
VIGAGQTKGSILQEHDSAEVVDTQIETKLNYMKTRSLKTDWFIPLVGIAVVAGSVVAGSTYLDLERMTAAEEAFTVTLDRLYHDQQIAAALKTIRDGEANVAAQRLDLLLCEHILRTDSELRSADARTRTFVENAFRRIAMIRPKTANGAAASSAQECSDDQTAAENILSKALGIAHTAQAQ